MPDPALDEIHNHRAAGPELGTSGQPTAAQLQSIAAAGFGTVINLAPDDDPRYALPDEAGTVRALGLDYVSIPVPFDAPDRELLAEFFDAMDARAGERVWVHCVANMRVSAFVGLYRVLRRGWEPEPAFALMRDLWEPNAVWSAFIAEMLAERPRPSGL